MTGFHFTAKLGEGVFAILRYDEDDLSDKGGSSGSNPNEMETPPDQQLFIAGTTQGSCYGAIYDPHADLTIVGTADSNRGAGEVADCLVIIADEIEIKGGVVVNANSTCSAGQAPDFLPSEHWVTLAD